MQKSQERGYSRWKKRWKRREEEGCNQTRGSRENKKRKGRKKIERGGDARERERSTAETG